MGRDEAIAQRDRLRSLVPLARDASGCGTPGPSERSCPVRRLASVALSSLLLTASSASARWNPPVKFPGSAGAGTVAAGLGDDGSALAVFREGGLARGP